MVGDRNWIPSLVMGLVPGGRGGGEGDSIVFHLRFLTHSVCRCDVT